jgi:exoribonuclease R
LIEEFMILANVAAAETLEQKQQQLIYRAHDEPSQEKINALAEFLATIGIKLAKLRYRIRSLWAGVTIPPRLLYYEVMTSSGFAELRRQPWPRLKMAREIKRELAESRN